MHLFNKFGKIIYNPNMHLLMTPPEDQKEVSVYNPHGYARYRTASSAMYLLKLAAECTGSELPPRAHDILAAVIGLQCTDAASDSFGLWTFDAEKDAASDPNPDGNTTSFVGVPLLIILLEYSKFFSDEEQKSMETALKRACVYIMHRLLTPDSTHIIYSETFLAAACGERFGIPEFVRYASVQIQALYNRTQIHNSFNTYNSPLYDFYSLSEIYFICRYVKNNAICETAKKLCELHWEIIARHYHCKSGEIAAPNSRFAPQKINRGFLPAEQKQFLADVGNMSKYFNKIFDFRYTLPAKLLGYFKKERTAFEQTIITNGYTFPYFYFSHVASTMMHPDYSVGSLSRNLIWYETVPFFAHFGTFSSPMSASLTVLHDGIPFSSSESAALQYQNFIMGHITFATNRADRHINNDPIQGRVTASELCIRFAINGDSSKIEYTAGKSGIRAKSGNVRLFFRFDYFKFDKINPKTSVTKKDNCICFDLVLHRGKKKVTDFKKKENAIAAWSFFITAENELPPETNCRKKENYFISQCPFHDSTLQLKSLYKPDTHENIQTQNLHSINGCPLEKYVTNRNLNISSYSYIDKFSPRFPIDILSGDRLSEEIDNILNIDIKYIIPYVTGLLERLKNQNLAIQKRISMQILANTYEVLKKYDVKFDIVISQISAGAAAKISVAETDSEIFKTVIGHLNKLMNISDNHSSSDTLLNSAMQIINDEFQNPDLSLEYISGKLNVPVYTISKIFSKNTDTSYNAYLLKKRMEHAKALLNASTLCADEIALQCGYLNTSSFRRAFKSYSGMTVSGFKRLLENT